MMAAFKADGDEIISSRPRIPLSGKWQYQILADLKGVPGPSWKETSLPGEFTFKDGENMLVLERELEVPASFANRIVALHINQLYYGALVEVNGKAAGEIPTWGGEADVTAFVKLGEKNRFTLRFPRLGQGLALDALTRATVDFMDKHQGPRLGNLGFHNMAGIICLPDGFYLESQPADTMIEDVWYKSYTRGGVKIEPVATFRVDKPVSDLSAQVVIYESNSGKKALEGTFPIARLTREENVQSFPMKADVLKLWELRNPNLYRGQIIVRNRDGQEVDRSELTTFGVRDFWVQGRDFLMNGEKVHFVMDGIHNKFNTVAEAFEAGVTLMPGRYWNSEHIISNSEATISECDRLGLACTTNGVTTRHLNLSDLEVLRAYRQWTVHHLRKLRNHPSVLLWSIDYNIGIGPNSFWPTELGRAKYTFWGNTNVSLGSLIHREVDPTRETYVHGGIIAPGVATCNIYLNHIPYQESEEWPSEWAEKGDRPFVAIEYMGSVLEQDFQKNMRSYVTEYAARLQGDRAYREELDDYVSYAAFEVPRFGGDVWSYNPASRNPAVAEILREGHLKASRAWRFWGTTVRPWIFNPDMITNGDQRPVDENRRQWKRSIWQAYLESIRPVQIWIGGPAGTFTAKNANFHSGETIEKSLVALRDLPGMDYWKVAWDAKKAGGAGAPIAQGSFSQSAGPYARIQTPFRFTAPLVEKPEDIVISMVVSDKETGAEIARDQFTARIFPEAWPRHSRPVAAPRFAVMDPQGETSRWLSQIGVETVPFAHGRTGNNVLVIGRRALRTMKGSMPFTAEDVANGLRVVIMEQHCRDLSRIGIRNEDQCPRQVFIRQPSHTFAAGIQDEHLRDWRGEGTLIGRGPEGDRLPQNKRTGHWGNRGTVASVIAETPHFGPFSAIMDCEFDLAYSPLLSWRHGKGEIVFCQLDLTGRVGSDPAATAVARNLVQYLSNPIPDAPQSKKAVAWDEAVVRRISALGFAAAAPSAPLNPASDLLVIDGKAPLSQERRKEAIAFAKAGGDVLVLGAKEDLLGEGRLKVSPATMTRAARTVENHPLLRGIGPALVHWREPLAFLSLSSDDPSFTRLLGGLAGVQSAGKGRIAYLQALPEAADDFSAAVAGDTQAGGANVKPVADDWRRENRARSRWNLLKLDSAILANLGVQSSPELASRLFELKSEVAPCVPVNDWVYLGPFVPSENPNADPLAMNLDQYRNSRDLARTFTNSKGEKVAWTFPTDSQNGLGVGGFMDLSRCYGARLMHTAFAVTQIYSSRPRQATIKFGADWWAIIYVNGKEVFRTVEGKGEHDNGTFGDGFANSFTCPLKAGWNDITIQVAAGSNGHNFSFKISNPGDLVVEQAITPPAEPPANLPAAEDLMPESVTPGFSLYADGIENADDPYLYIRW